MKIKAWSLDKCSATRGKKGETGVMERSLRIQNRTWDDLEGGWGKGRS